MLHRNYFRAFCFFSRRCMAILSRFCHLSMGSMVASLRRSTRQRPPLQCLTFAPSKTPFSHFSPSKYFSAFVCIYMAFSFAISVAPSKTHFVLATPDSARALFLSSLHSFILAFSRVCPPVFSSAVSRRCALESLFLARCHNFQPTCFSFLPVNALTCICEGVAVHSLFYSFLL